MAGMYDRTTVLSIGAKRRLVGALLLPFALVLASCSGGDRYESQSSSTTAISSSSASTPSTEPPPAGGSTELPTTGGSTQPPSTDGSTGSPGAGEGPTAAPVLPTVEGSLDDEIALTTGMAIKVAAIKVIEVTAETPGDMAGSAVQVDIDVMNQSSETQSVDSAVVSMGAEDGQFAIPANAGGAEHLSGQVDPEQTASGRYIFLLDDPVGRAITVSVNYGAGEPVAEFTGKVS